MEPLPMFFERMLTQPYVSFLIAAVVLLVVALVWELASWWRLR